MSSKVLFLCTGNYYRSRFAEYLFNHEATQHKLDWRADSCGLALELGTGNEGPISTHTVTRLQEHDIHLGDNLRFPRQVTEEDLRSVQLVVALDRSEHEPMMTARHPKWADKIEYWNVADLGFVAPDDALGQIEQQVQALVTRLSKEGPP